MGFYIRISVKNGSIRIDFSKSEIGVSSGIKGARISTGPRGTYKQLVVRLQVTSRHIRLHPNSCICADRSLEFFRTCRCDWLSQIASLANSFGRRCCAGRGADCLSLNMVALEGIDS